MSLYNMIAGVRMAAFFVLPMLGEKHPDEYPRFRDCFLGDESHPEYDDHIHVFTRVGGGNRGCGYGEEELMAHPCFVTTFDDPEDSTYASYVFTVPEEWKADFAKFKDGNLKDFSSELKARIRKVFPKLKEKMDELWGPEPDKEGANG